jgi:hypothetical protein
MNKKIKHIALLCSIASSMFFGASFVTAATSDWATPFTWYYYDAGCDCNLSMPIDGSYGHASTDKDVYAPGETITLSGWTVRNDAYFSSWNAAIGFASDFGQICDGSNICGGSKTGTAPMTPGVYPIGLYICWIDVTHCAASWVWYTVAGAPVVPAPTVDIHFE